jgi:hypothetical protein
MAVSVKKLNFQETITSVIIAHWGPYGVGNSKQEFPPLGHISALVLRTRDGGGLVAE